MRAPDPTAITRVLDSLRDGTANASGSADRRRSSELYEQLHRAADLPSSSARGRSLTQAYQDAQLFLAQLRDTERLARRR